MERSPDLDALVVRESCLELFAKCVYKGFHLVWRLQVARRDEVGRLHDSLFLHDRRRPSNTSGRGLLGLFFRELLDSSGCGVELLDRLSLPLGDMGDAFFVLDALTKVRERLQASEPQRSVAVYRCD